MKKIIATIIIVGLFVISGNIRALELPIAPCDDAQATTAHLAPMEREDGTKAFTYGSGGNAFASQTGAVVSLSFDLLFTSQPSTIIKLYFMDANCAIGAGYAFQQEFPQSNTFAYDSNTDNLTVNSEAPLRVMFNTLPRYIWLEVADKYPNPEKAAYSYLVDLQDLQNPAESSDPAPSDEGEPEIRLTPDPVIVIPGILGSQEKNGVWLMDPILHTYTDLIGTFRANGYQDNYDLFPFPYDWRKSNTETAEALRLRIMEAKNLCLCDKVDIVAHSMGGLVARQYIQSGDYGHDIDQLIFLGTPHLGAPKAYLIWETGEVGSSVADQALKFLLTHEGRKQGYLDFLSYVHARIPSVAELLPVFDYLKDSDEEPQNQFLESLDQQLPGLYDSQVNITNIVGELEGESTIRYIAAENFNFEKGTGDGTVPNISGEHINQDLRTFWAVGHSQLPAAAASEVFYTLTGEEPETVSDKFNFPDVKLLIIKMLSPADMLVTAPDGKRVGKDFETGQEVSEIDGAFYSGFLTDDEYITILNPVEGEYQITTQGTGTGEYTVATAYITADGSVETEVTSSTEPGLVENLDYIISNDSSRFNLEVPPVISGGGGYVQPEEIYDSGKVLGASINTIKDGSLVLDSNDGRTIYMIGDGKKYGFVSAEVFLGMGFRFEQVIFDNLSSYEMGEAVSSLNQPHPSGSLIYDGQTIWFVSGQKHLGFATMEEFVSAGFEVSQVVAINQADLELEISNY